MDEIKDVYILNSNIFLLPSSGPSSTSSVITGPEDNLERSISFPRSSQLWWEQQGHAVLVGMGERAEA